MLYTIGTLVAFDAAFAKLLWPLVYHKKPQASCQHLPLMSDIAPINRNGGRVLQVEIGANSIDLLPVCLADCKVESGNSMSLLNETKIIYSLVECEVSGCFLVNINYYGC